MRKIDILCASQAATAIRLSMEHPSSSSAAAAGSSSPAIDRHNPIISDCRRSATPLPPPPLPPLTRHRKKKKSPKIPPAEINGGGEKETKKSVMQIPRKSWSCTKPGDFISPPGSTRYLLSGKELLSALSDFDLDHPPRISNTKDEQEGGGGGEEVREEREREKAAPSSPAADQVVVLRVSLHCRGCERKMRKHISRMEGVRSFNIDFAAKKVTVSGKVTPLEVLSSISKVKNAQLWAPTIASEFRGPFPLPLPLLNNTNNKGVAAAVS